MFFSCPRASGGHTAWTNELPRRGRFLSSVGQISKLEPSLCEPGNIAFQCLQNAVSEKAVGRFLSSFLLSTSPVTLEISFLPWKKSSMYACMCVTCVCYMFECLIWIQKGLVFPRSSNSGPLQAHSPALQGKRLRWKWRWAEHPNWGMWWWEGAILRSSRHGRGV